MSIAGYSGLDDDITIPQEINGRRVTAIDPAAFALTWVTRVVLPDTVQVIGNSAFLMCSELEEVILPEGLMRIESSAFMGCAKLTSIRIPAGTEV